MSNKNNNKKFKNFMNSLSTFRLNMKPIYRKYFDEISSLYINRQIVKQSEVMKLLNKLTGRGQAPKSAIKLIENKYRNQKSIRKEKPIKSYYVTASFDVRTMWYKNNSPVMIDDDNAKKLTDLYLNKYNSAIFSVYKDPKYHVDKDGSEPYSKIVQGNNGQHIENMEYSKSYLTENYYDLQKLIKSDVINDFTINDQYKSKFIKATTLVSNSLSDVKLKWRNFVDDDEDNSKEEKYVKKSILDILKSKTAAKII